MTEHAVMLACYSRHMLLISGQEKAEEGDKNGIQLLTCSEAIYVVHVFKDYSKFLMHLDFCNRMFNNK